MVCDGCSVLCFVLLFEVMIVSMLNYKKDSYVVISYGDYDRDYIDSVARVLKDFNAYDQLIIWANETGRKLCDDSKRKNLTNTSDKYVKHSDSNYNIDYVEHLISIGLIEKIEYKALHIGRNGDTELTSDS